MTESVRHNPLAGTRLNIRAALSQSPPVLDFVLPGLLAGTVGVLVGPGGVGKTMLELQIAAALATGLSPVNGLFDRWGGIRNLKPCRIVMVAAEEPMEVLTCRLHNIIPHMIHSAAQAGAAVDAVELLDLLDENLVIHSLADAPRLHLIGDDLGSTDDGQALIEACAGARLVILDPLRQFHQGDENDSKVMDALVYQCKRIGRAKGSQKKGPAVLIVHHANRAAALYEQGDSADATRGSTSLTAGARWQMNMSKPSKATAKALKIRQADLHRYVQLDLPKANYGPKQSYTFLEQLAGGVFGLASLELEPESNAAP